MAQQRFKSQVKRWAVRANISQRVLLKRIAFGLWGRLIDATPRDTGRAQSNWNLVPGDVADLTTRDAGEPSPMPTATSADSWTISNNLHYILALEEGHSSQAPAGMVKTSIASEKALLEHDLGP